MELLNLVAGEGQRLFFRSQKPNLFQIRVLHFDSYRQCDGPNLNHNQLQQNTMVGRSSLARAVFFGAKPCPSQIIHCSLRRPSPPVHDISRWSPLCLPYSTKPTTEPLHSPQKKTLSTNNVQSSLSDSSVAQLPSTSLLNPPPSTRPPPFILPDAPAKRNLAYFYKLGKASLTFYKNGIKAIYANYKLRRSIRARLSKYARRMPRIELLKQGLISRAEYHLLQRTDADLSRAPLFALIFLVFSEYTPLVVVAFSGAVPRTLWIPKQVQRAREKQQKRRNAAKETWQRTPSSDSPRLLTDPETVLGIGRMMGVYPAWWDRFLLWKPVGTVRSRVQRRLRETEVDDMAIERDGSVQELEEQELTLALEARGIDVLAKNEEELRENLTSWLRRRKEESPIDLIANWPPSLSSQSSSEEEKKKE